MNIITIPNINNYTIQVIDNTLIITKVIPYISEEELFKQDLKNSNILRNTKHYYCIYILI